MSRQWEEPDLLLDPGEGDIPVSRDIFVVVVVVACNHLFDYFV